MRPFDDRAPARAIIGFHQEDDGQWVADLTCGHGQHVRHDPPWQDRSWVMTEQGRDAHRGTTLPCMRCLEELAPAAEP